MTSRLVRLWLPAVALTMGIESIQAFLPGRNPLLVDVLANAAGAGLGLLLVAALLRGRGPCGHRGFVPPLVAWGVSAAILGGTGWAFQLDPPPPPHVLQLQAELGHLEFYQGQVTAVHLGEERLDVGSYPDPGWLEARIFGGATLAVEFEVGPPPRGIAPLFSIYTGTQREVLLLGVQGSDLVVRLPYRAANLRLDRPDHRLRLAMADAAPGDRMRVLHAFHPRGEPGPAGAAGGCLRLESISGEAGNEPAPASCGLRPTLGDGWQLLLFVRGLPPSLHVALSGLWLLGLGLLAGLFAGSWRRAALAGAGLVGVGLILPWIMGSMAVLTPGQGLALLAGVAGGWGGWALSDRGRSGVQAQAAAGTRAPRTDFDTLPPPRS